MIQSILFFGNYPNPVSPTLNVFFRNLIYEIADLGVKCTVITPVSVTKYRHRIKEIPLRREEVTSKGSVVTVLSPRSISITARKIGPFDLHVTTVSLSRIAAISEAHRLKEKFDATYGHFINVGGVCACNIGHEYNVPCFVANGESDLNPRTYNYDSPYRINDFKYCNGVISVSQKNADELKALNLIDDSLIRIFPNGVDHNLFFKRDKHESRKKFGFNDKDIIAVYVGGFSHRKGFKRVLEAAKEIPGIKLAFAGEGDSIPFKDNILFCDRVAHEELPILLSAADFFVLPTLNEGCCNAILEALACGLPVISSNLAFNDDVLSEENSIRIDPLNIDDIRGAMKSLFYDEKMRNRLSEGAIITSKKFDITQRAINILDFMNQQIIAEDVSKD